MNVLGSTLWRNLFAGMLLIVILASTTVLALKKGIVLDRFTLGDMTISGFELVWKDRLEISVATVNISSRGPQSSIISTFTDSSITRRMVSPLTRAFSRLSIGALYLQDYKTPLRITLDGAKIPYQLVVDSDILSVHGHISTTDAGVALTITQGKSQQIHSTFTGRLHFDSGSQKAEGDVTLVTHKQMNMTVMLGADAQKLTFHGHSNDPLNSINEIVRGFNLSPKISYWFDDALYGSSFLLKEIGGTVEWRQPKNLLHNLYAKGEITDCDYTISTGLLPIKSPLTKINYAGGILTIIPHKPSYGSIQAEGSRFEINFNDPGSILLSAYLRASTPLDNELSDLLRHYDISLPFRQTKGTTQASLDLTINLNSGAVMSTGKYLIKDSDFTWKNRTIHIDALNIEQHNAVLHLDQLELSYATNASANITGKIDFTNETGELNGSIKKASIPFGTNMILLTRPFTTFTYRIRPEGHTLTVPGTEWQDGGLTYRLERITATIDFQESRATVAPTKLTIDDTVPMSIAGSFNIATGTLRLQADIEPFSTGNVELASPVTITARRNDSSWQMAMSGTSSLKINNALTEVFIPHLTFANGTIAFKNTETTSGKISAVVSGDYDLADGRGNFRIDRFSSPFSELTDIYMQASLDGIRLKLDLPELGLHILARNRQTIDVRANDLKLLKERLGIFSHIQTGSGSMTLSSEDGGKSFTVDGWLEKPPPLFLHGGIPLSNWHISGLYSADYLRLSLNDRVTLEVEDTLKIRLTDTELHVPEITRLISKLQTTKLVRDDDNGATIEMSAEADNISLLLTDTKKILVDSLSLKHSGQVTTASLQHRGGSARLFKKAETFQIDGNKLDSDFTNALLGDTRFKGGLLSIAAHGSRSSYSMVARMEDSVLERSTLFNSILTFVNAVPTLATFSLPEFGTKGLSVESAVLGMTVIGNKADIRSFELTSPQLSMTGTGGIDLEDTTVDVELNLITQAKKNISKIPLLGYLIVGEKKLPSITVKVTGPIDQPDIKHTAYKKIVTTPFSILYRTLTLPIELVEPMLQQQGTE